MQIVDKESLAHLVQSLNLSRTLTYGAAILLVVYRVAVRFDLSSRQACVAVLPPIAAVMGSLWGVNALLSSLPTR